MSPADSIERHQHPHIPASPGDAPDTGGEVRRFHICIEHDLNDAIPGHRHGADRTEVGRKVQEFDELRFERRIAAEGVSVENGSSHAVDIADRFADGYGHGCSSAG